MNISIVTVHLNDFDGLISTHRSLRSLLEKQQVNWLVIDGGTRLETPEQQDCFLAVRQAFHGLVINRLVKPDANRIGRS